MVTSAFDKKCLSLFKGHRDREVGGYDPIKHRQEWCYVQDA
jgi:hypothetical protein